MENKICILIPYFGKFNNYFNLWAYSASKNSKIDFYIISERSNEQNVPKYPNLFFVPSTLKDLKQRFSNFFEFECCLKTPYKLCDYKPFYYAIFPEIIKEYEYWGFGDVDLIYGNVLGLLPQNIEKYDVLFKLGHLMICKNSQKLNDIFLNSIPKNLIKEVYTSDKSFYFDERDYSHFNIAKNANLSVYDNDDLIADIYSYSSTLKLVKKYKENQSLLFHFNNGKLKSYEIINNKLKESEYIYIHLQKRRMSNKVKKITDFYINGNSLFNHKSNNVYKITNKYANKKLVSWFKILIHLRLKQKFKRMKKSTSS